MHVAVATRSIFDTAGHPRATPTRGKSAYITLVLLYCTYNTTVTRHPQCPPHPPPNHQPILHRPPRAARVHASYRTSHINHHPAQAVHLSRPLSWIAQDPARTRMPHDTAPHDTQELSQLQLAPACRDLAIVADQPVIPTRVITTTPAPLPGPRKRPMAIPASAPAGERLEARAHPQLQVQSP